MSAYAIQCLMMSGWCYVGSCEGDREVFPSREEAQAELDSIMPDLIAMGHSEDEWRVEEYIEENDSKEDM